MEKAKLTADMKAELDKFKGKRGSVIPYKIGMSEYGIDVEEIKTVLRLKIQKEEKKGVQLVYYSLKSDIDSEGFAEVEVCYRISTTKFTGSTILGSGKSIMKTTVEKKYKRMRIMLMNFNQIHNS